MIDKVLDERGSRYGTFADHAQIAQGLQDVIRGAPNWHKMPADAKQSLTVICDKMARMLNGDANYDDNWIDIIGYATLILNRINADKREAAQSKDSIEKLTATMKELYAKDHVAKIEADMFDHSFDTKEDAINYVKSALGVTPQTANPNYFTTDGLEGHRSLRQG